MTAAELLNANIIALLGLEALPEDQKIAMVQKMTVLVQKRLANRVSELLTDEEADEVAAMGDAPEDILNYLAEHVENLDQLVEAEIVKLKQEMLTVANKVDAKLEE
jgi:hypothetical protein